MMTILLDYILIPLITLSILYAAYRILDFIAKKNAHQWLEKEKQRLKEKESALERTKLTSLEDISEKKSAAMAEYQKAVQAIKTAEQIRTDTQATITQLTRENKQLSEELHAARHRAIRIAKRSQTTV